MQKLMGDCPIFMGHPDFIKLGTGWKNVEHFGDKRSVTKVIVIGFVRGAPGQMGFDRTAEIFQGRQRLYGAEVVRSESVQRDGLGHLDRLVIVVPRDLKARIQRDPCPALFTDNGPPVIGIRDFTLHPDMFDLKVGNAAAGNDQIVRDTGLLEELGDFPRISNPREIHHTLQAPMKFNDAPDVPGWEAGSPEQSDQEGRLITVIAASLA